MGIPNPVTRETHGTGDKYNTELAKELSKALMNPLKVSMNYQVRILFLYITRQFYQKEQGLYNILHFNDDKLTIANITIYDDIHITSFAEPL